MKLRWWDVERAVHYTAHALLTPHPTYADGALAQSEAMEEERRRQKKPLLDVWFECHHQGRVIYIIERSDGGGEYRPTRPPNVPQSQVVPITVRGDRFPASALFEDLHRRLGRLGDLIGALVPGANLPFDLEKMPAKADVERLLALMANARTAMQPDFDEARASQFTGKMNGAALRYAGSRDLSKVQEEVRKARAAIDALREALGCDAMLTACIRLLDDLAEAMLKHESALGRPKAETDAAYLTRIVEVSQTSKDHPLHLIGFAMARALRAGGLPAVTELADRYRQEGADGISSALEAKTRHAHGQELYRAAIPLFAARELYRGLVQSAPLLPQMNLERMQTYSSVAEENLVKVEDALLFALRNRNDDLLAAQRTRVQGMIKSQGAAKAQAHVDDTIEQRFYYPRVYKSHLIGGPKPSEE